MKKNCLKNKITEWIRLVFIGLLLFAFFAGAGRVQAQTSPQYVYDIPAGMVLVEGGNSTLGAAMDNFEANSDAKPQQVVQLAPFYIDALEVTNRDYAKCVAAGYCEEPAANESETRQYYYSYEGYGRFPVVNVTWENAKSYCDYMGKKLPTEAEWEKAAMGNLEFRRYPWGNGVPQPYYVNLSGVPGDTEMGNSYPKGVSTYGMLDAIGNVSEWVADWYASDAYSKINPNNPTGPAEGTQKVIRGDSFKMSAGELNLTNRYSLEPDKYRNDLGFRCAKNVQENITYNIEPTAVPNSDSKQAVVNSGQESGMFVLDEPGLGKNLMCIYKRGVIVEILEGPKEIAYTRWYKIKGPTGCEGWSLGSNLEFVGQ